MFERIATRAVALGLSGLVTLTIVTALGDTADRQHAQALQAYAQDHPALRQATASCPRTPRS